MVQLGDDNSDQCMNKEGEVQFVIANTAWEPAIAFSREEGSLISALTTSTPRSCRLTAAGFDKSLVMPRSR